MDCLERLYERYPALEVCRTAILQSVELLERCARADGTVLLCGNGGSSADCDHMAAELMKGFLQKRPLSQREQGDITRLFPEDGEQLASALQRSVRAISLPTQTAVLTAFANDVNPEMAFAQLAYGYGRTGDVLMALSTSGNALNVVNAVKAAKAKGLYAIGMTGRRACALDDLCDCVVKVPATETYQVQEYHLPVYHAICAEVEQRLFGEE